MSISGINLPKIEIEVRDGDSQLLQLIEYIRILAAPGHSFDVIVDPDSSENRRSFFMDGDGSFYIKNVKLDGIKVKSKDGKIIEEYLKRIQC